MSETQKEDTSGTTGTPIEPNQQQEQHESNEDEEDFNNVPMDAPNKITRDPAGKYIEVGPFTQLWRFGKNIPVYDYDRQTLYDGFLRSLARAPDHDFLGVRRIDPATGTYERKYTFMTYAEAHTAMGHLGSFLRNQTLGEGQEQQQQLLPRGAMVGIFARNCPQWIIAQYACYRHSLVPVPLYSTLGDAAVRFILAQCQVPVVVAAPKSIAALIRLAYERDSAAEAATTTTTTTKTETEEEKPGLRMVISTESDALPADAVAAAEQHGVRVLTWAEALAEGAAHVVEAEPPTPDELYGVIYTSGSTGTPKGAMITHRTVCNAADIMYSAPQFAEPVDGWRYISYLPLAHSMELELTSIMITGGGTIGFNTVIGNLFEDIEVLEASFFPTVPRLWKRFYDKVMEAVNASFVSRTLFGVAYAHKKAALETGAATWVDWDALVFDRIRSRLGPKMVLSMCGAAPMDRALIEWVRVTCGLTVYQVYGLTETFAGVSSQQLGYFSDVQCIGAPIGRTRVRLVDVPEMGYSIADSPPRGELLVHGPTVFRGYYKEPAKTAEVLSPDGWCATGDCARLNADGTITIIDRKKNLFKLAQGEYVAAEMVEMVYGFALCVAQVWVWANSLDPFLVAVVVPAEDVVRPVAEARFGFAPGAPWADICADPRVNAHVLHEMQHVGRERKLKGYEIVKGIVLEPVEWGPTCGLLTPTLKFMRAKMAAHYAPQLNALCAQIRSAPATSDSSSSASPSSSSGSSWFSWFK